MAKRIVIIVGIALVIASFFFYIEFKHASSTHLEVGQKIDSLNGVVVYYNGDMDNVLQRNTKGGYNLGLEYQCVEFVKRYYYEYYHHKMPDSYGHAISFYDSTIVDGEMNTARNLLQFSNPSLTKPAKGDLIVMDTTSSNEYGHVAIVSNVNDTQVEIIQQNPGADLPSRETFELNEMKDGRWNIEHARILGWLRKKES